MKQFACVLIAMLGCSKSGAPAPQPGGESGSGTAAAPARASSGPAPVTVALGHSHSCAIVTDGSLRCWGAGFGSALERTVKIEHVVVDLGEQVRSIAAGAWHTCAILESGAVRCVGPNKYRELGLVDAPLLPGSLDVHLGGKLPLPGPAIALAAGGYHSCALVADGSVHCWGGRRLEGADPGTPAIRKVELPGPASRLAAGRLHTCALLEKTGEVVCWGRNDQGQLGGPGKGADEPDATVAAAVGLGGRATELWAGGASTCARRADDAIVCWGGNDSGQLGLGHAEDLGLERPVSDGVLGLEQVAEVQVNNNHACVRTRDGQVRCFGDAGYSTNRLGYAERTAMGDDEPAAKVPVLDVGGKARAIALGNNHTCVVLESKRLRCWGENDAGQLGQLGVDTTATPAAYPELPATLTVR